jgi:hypothetical protein
VLRPVNRSLLLYHLLSCIKKLFSLPFMSHTHPTASTSSSSNQASNFQLIIVNALDTYKRRTKKDLLAHPLVSELQSCNSPSAILAILQQQLEGLDQSRRSDERWTRWLDPTVNVLFTLTETLGEGVSLVRFRSSTYLEICALMSIWQVFSPAKVIFVGVGVLLSVCIPSHLLPSCDSLQRLHLSGSKGCSSESRRSCRCL